MPYPMMQWPTFAEFRNRLVDEFECEYKQLPASLTVDDGEPKPIYYFKRDIDGDIRRYTVAIPDDVRLEPSIIRSVCTRLGINPAAFGLVLG